MWTEMSYHQYSYEHNMTICDRLFYERELEPFADVEDMGEIDEFNEADFFEKRWN